MAVAVLLDQWTLPVKGTVELHLDYSFQINISAEEARRKVHHWVLTEVSCMMGALAPTLRVGQQIAWRVPIELTAPHLGQVGVAGTVDVNVQTGNMEITPEHKEQILEGARRLAQKMPPYVQREADSLLATYIAADQEPTVHRPSGTPREIIEATRRSQPAL
jgi:hypothetical protein